MPSFSSHAGFSIPVAHRFSSAFAKSRSRAFREIFFPSTDKFLRASLTGIFEYAPGQEVSNQRHRTAYT